MIQQFVNRFMSAEGVIRAELRAKHPDDYDALVKRVVEIVGVEEQGVYDDRPDPDRITVIDHGDYQGTRLYIIGARGYQPSVYWSVFVDYGSCSGCDTLERIRDYGDEPPADKQVGEYWTLMLHIVQDMRRLSARDTEDE